MLLFQGLLVVQYLKTFMCSVCRTVPKVTVYSLTRLAPLAITMASLPVYRYSKCIRITSRLDIVPTSPNVPFNTRQCTNTIMYCITSIHPTARPSIPFLLPSLHFPPTLTLILLIYLLSTTHSIRYILRSSHLLISLIFSSPNQIVVSQKQISIEHQYIHTYLYLLIYIKYNIFKQNSLCIGIGSNLYKTMSLITMSAFSLLISTILAYVFATRFDKYKPIKLNHNKNIYQRRSQRLSMSHVSQTKYLDEISNDLVKNNNNDPELNNLNNLELTNFQSKPNTEFLIRNISTNELKSNNTENIKEEEQQPEFDSLKEKGTN